MGVYTYRVFDKIAALVSVPGSQASLSSPSFRILVVVNHVGGSRSKGEWQLACFYDEVGMATIISMNGNRVDPVETYGEGKCILNNGYTVKCVYNVAITWSTVAYRWPQQCTPLDEYILVHLSQEQLMIHQLTSKFLELVSSGGCNGE